MSLFLRKVKLFSHNFNRGVLWERPDIDELEFENWYAWMQKSNEESLGNFQDVVLQWRAKIKSVIEVGAGTGIFFPNWFAKNTECVVYNLVEPSVRAIQSAKKNLKNENLTLNYFATHIEKLPKTLKSDLLISFRSIDVSGDINGFIKKCTQKSKHIYITFANEDNGLKEHFYRWDTRGYYWSSPSIIELKHELSKYSDFLHRINLVPTTNNPKGEIHLIMWPK